ncbi:cyclic pyranopterin monophosphate synthase MoaC [Salisaeta longa]|uniref:cyclic pyranopterin monophosphate synthase MoaC n=1 Tax=Salisaeta longa TaxID=503170 RepID=UPI0003B7AB11|nr:cyclic pyranopterin monophosphate synthase MoaC [Salisaeta longa]
MSGSSTLAASTQHLSSESSGGEGIRTAVAQGRVLLSTEAFEQLREGTIQKGDVLTVANIAGIMGAKQTSTLLPLCHDAQINGIDIDFSLDAEAEAVVIRAYAKSLGITGVGMEALTAVSVAALTVFDMCKSIDKNIQITDIRLLAKTGGQSGSWKRAVDA